jgi:large subunit ribosomal protein L17
MHRRGYQGRKFGRERDQRRALINGLAESLIVHESIETTLPKAKDLMPYMEKLITKAKKGDLASRRLIISSLSTTESAHKLVDELAPKMKSRSSGHMRIERTKTRRGDNAQLARISFILDSTKGSAEKKDIKQPAVKVADKHTEDEAKLKEMPKTKLETSKTGKVSSKTSVVNVAKRSGVRGNR